MDRAVPFPVGISSPAAAEHVGDGLTLGAVRAAGDRVLCEWSWPQAEDGTVLRGVDLYLVRDGLIAAKDVFSKITIDG